MINAIQPSFRDQSVYGWQPQNAGPLFCASRASGIYIYDVDGREYMDFASGQINVNVGYGNRHVNEAISKQLSLASYVSPRISTDVRARLAEAISQITPTDLDFVFFTNSGSESVENALKIARRVTGRSKILAAWQSYHGNTAGASAISGDPRRLFAEPAMPGISHFNVPGVYKSPFGIFDRTFEAEVALSAFEHHLEMTGPRTVAAVVIEPVSGTSGLYVHPKSFLDGVRRACDKYGIILIADETMAGWGRTGKWFSFEHTELRPDLIVTAKGLTSGYVPMGAVILSRAIYKEFNTAPFVGGLTTEAHSLGCAAGIANIDVYRGENLLDKSRESESVIADLLKEIAIGSPIIADVRGVGSFFCMEVGGLLFEGERLGSSASSDGPQMVADLIFKKCLSKGLILLRKESLLFIAPPLIASQDEIRRGITILQNAASEICGCAMSGEVAWSVS